MASREGTSRDATKEWTTTIKGPLERRTQGEAVGSTGPQTSWVQVGTKGCENRYTLGQGSTDSWGILVLCGTGSHTGLVVRTQPGYYFLCIFVTLFTNNLSK